MAHPTPRADALRQMREAKFEAEQKRLKQETGKPAETAKRKPEPDAGDEHAAKPAVAKKAAPKQAKATAIAAETGADTTAAAPAAKGSTDKAAKKAAPKKAVAKKVKASAK